MKSRLPKSRGEWQEAADAAEACIVLDSARQYGLVNGGPRVDVERCAELLAQAKNRGIRPAPDCVERFVKELAKAVT